MADPAWFQTVDRRTPYRGWSTVHVDTVRLPAGGTVEREVVDHLDAVAVVPVIDDTVLLLRQYRHPVGTYVLEIPAGVLDVDGETPDHAAHRELVEEVGMRAGELTHLTTFLNSAGWNTERTHVYVGTGLAPATPSDDFDAHAEEADMEVVRLPIPAAVAGVRDGTITDAKTIIGLLLVATDKEHA